MINQEPPKWREGIDPMSLPLKTVAIQEILGYPHAGNQVFHVKGVQDGKEGYYYLKYAHHADANFKNEVEILSQLHCPQAPEVVEYDVQGYQYELTRQIEGQRLSMILAEAGSDNGLGYLATMGKALARLHGSDGSFPDAPHRSYHDIPECSRFAEAGMERTWEWLVAHKPVHTNRCFVHGDFHYANVLWKDGRISAILDFELAGMGNREYDIAWALILRPGQRFLRTEEEFMDFITGYASVGACDLSLVRYYMVLIYFRFMKAGDAEYEQFIRRWIGRNTV